MMESEAGRETEDDGTRRRSLSMEDLRRKYPWWPSSSASKGPSTLIEMDPASGGGGEAGQRSQEHQTVRSGSKTETL
jgi:hypothetical protein